MEDITISNSQITSSSNFGGNPAWKGRLNGGECWFPSGQNAKGEWFQVEFLSVVTVKAIQTQGCPNYGEEYVTDLQVAIGYSQDSLHFIRDDDGMVKVSLN